MKKLWLLLPLLALPVRADERHGKLGDPAWLTPSVRRLIRTRMNRHEERMSELVWAVILLDYPLVQRAAHAIEVAPSPLEPTADLKEVAPLFFQQQDLLKQRAGLLAAAAQDRNGLEMGAAYKQVAETCVTCHVAYLNPPGAKP